MAARKLGSGIKNISAENADIDHYWVLGSTGSVSINGYFVDGHGDAVLTAAGVLAPGFSGTVPAASAGMTDAVNFATIAGLTGTLTFNYPDVAGVIFDCAGNLRYMTANSFTGAGVAVPPPDFKANPTRYPTINAGNSIPLSQVAKV